MQSSATGLSDLASLKRKFPFLHAYSDEFIMLHGPHALIKLEAAARKLQDLDRGRKAEDKLLANREALYDSATRVEAGLDNRLDKISPARFLPGAVCPLPKLWLKARDSIGAAGHSPLSTYDMGSIGLGGCVSARGWVELHDPSSTSISIKMFSMGNTEKRGKGQDADFNEMEDLTELKNAVRVLRAANSIVNPWSHSIDALESFLIQSSFCSTDLAGVDKQVVVLTKFIDYVLVENANRWRDMEPFLTTRDLRGTWADFFGQKGATFQKKNQHKNPSFKPAGQTQQSQPPTAAQGQQSQPHNKYNEPRHLFMDDICYLWNVGRCIRKAGECTTKKGRQLKHICNYRPDPNNLSLACGKDHPCYSNHK